MSVAQGMTQRLSALVLVASLIGCAAELAGTRLGRVGTATDGHLLAVKHADFPSRDPRQGEPTTPGSAVLRDAVIADDGVAAFVAAHGLPDAIGVESVGFTIHLAYLRDGTLYTLEHSAAEWVSPRAWNPSRVTGERPLSEQELALIDPNRRAERLRTMVAQYGRVQAVGRRLLEATPPLGGPFIEYGMLLIPATEVAAQAYGGTASDAEEIVAWVDPAGPQRDVLRVGDRVTAVSGVAMPVAERTGMRWDGPKRLTIRRDERVSEVDVAPQSWPRRVQLVLIPEDVPNAFVVRGGSVIYVTQGLVELFPEDDPLAVVIGHELAHVALGHAERPGAASQLASSVLVLGMLPVLVPAELARPGTGRQLRGAVESGFNRDQERDADRLGVRYAREAGYDPQAALVVVDRLQARAPVEGIDQFFDLHPPYPERRALIEAELSRTAAAP